MKRKQADEDDKTSAEKQMRDRGPLMTAVSPGRGTPTDLHSYTGSRLRYAIGYSIGRNVPRAPPFSYRKNRCLLATSMHAHLFILKTLLIRRDLRNLLIKHAVQHHTCMPANSSSITNRYQFILNCVFPTRLCASGDVDV